MVKEERVGNGGFSARTRMRATTAFGAHIMTNKLTRAAVTLALNPLFLSVYSFTM